MALGPGEARDVPMRCECGQLSSAAVTAPWIVIDGPQDPFFGLPLWLRASVSGEELWAYNEAHLGVLEDFVTATLREREQPRNGSLASRLPRWIKARKNRARVIAGLARMRERLATG